MALWNNTEEMWGQFGFVLPSPTLVWPTPLGLPKWRGGQMHQHSTSGIRKRKRSVTLPMLTHGAMWGCGLTSLMVCINDTFCDIRERNMTIRSDIWTTKIRSLGFWEFIECVTLWKLILRSLGCISSLYMVFAEGISFTLEVHQVFWESETT